MCGVEVAPQTQKYVTLKGYILKKQNVNHKCLRAIWV
jgi:hypothetical protein